MAAFAQFGSDLDAGTKAKLDRGARVVELFKQGQYSPIAVEEQAAVLWSMKNGFLDQVPVDRVKEWQGKLQEYLQTRKADVLKSIDKDNEPTLKSAVEEFQQTFR